MSRRAMMVAPAGGGGGGGGGTSELIAIVGSKLWAHYELGTGLYTDAGSTAATSNGDQIYQWNDTSGNNRHAVNSGTSSTRPTLSTGTQYLSTNTVNFDRTSSQRLTLPDMSAITEGEGIIIIKKTSDTPGTDVDAATGLWYIGESDFSTHYRYTDGNIYEAFGCAVRRSVGNPGANGFLSSQFRAYNVRAKVHDYQIYMDNSSIFGPDTSVNTIAFTSTPLLGRSLGSTYYLNGNVATFAVFSPSLTSTERGNVYTALTT